MTKLGRSIWSGGTRANRYSTPGRYSIFDFSSGELNVLNHQKESWDYQQQAMRWLLNALWNSLFIS